MAIMITWTRIPTSGLEMWEFACMDSAFAFTVAEVGGCWGWLALGSKSQMVLRATASGTPIEVIHATIIPAIASPTP
jgi:hypothetical protein